MSIAYGQPSNISQVPTPAATVNIASSTNASPTVITTSTAHGLQTGMAIIINGHLVNTAVNGIWIATVLTSTTFKISTFSGFPGTFVNGVGVGVATGTVQSLALPGITIPEDLVTDIDAAAFNVPYEALADMTAWLAYKVLSNMTILAGGSMIFSSGASAATGLTLGALVNAVFNGTLTAAGPLVAGSTANFNGLSTFTGTAVFNSFTRPRQEQRPADAATIDLDVANGNIVVLTAPAASNRTVRIAAATARDWMLISYPANVAEELSFTVKRNGGADLAVCYTGSMRYGGSDVLVGGSLLLMVDSGGDWRGISASGYTIPQAGW